MEIKEATLGFAPYYFPRRKEHKEAVLDMKQISQGI